MSVFWNEHSFWSNITQDLGKQIHIPIIFQAIINYAIMTTVWEELKKDWKVTDFLHLRNVFHLANLHFPHIPLFPASAFTGHLDWILSIDIISFNY